MPLKRRQFVFLSGIGSFGLALLGKKLQSHSGEYTSDLNLVSQAQPLTSDPILRFVSLADTGTGAKGQYAVAQAMTKHHKQNAFDLAILAGDNIYNEGEIEKIGAVFERPYEPLLKQGVKFRACLGNHDIRTANGDPQVKYPGFNMQGRYYTFQRDAVQFFALDTNNNADWKLQLPWLETELSRSDAPWKVVFGHHQIYSSGHYGKNQELIKDLTPLFQKYNVKLYINGHDHNYERTRTINGTTYLTCGAGAGVRPVGRSEWTGHSAEKLSFAAYEVYSDRIEIQAIDTKNQVFDRGIVHL
ncbi:metallophosphoesterase [Gloeocapsopsis sp. IPPAS B-1203]|uniref:metallophosphoesterase n=1 Tax=Gloeocapsopsis sp. IPPAS B-1203 TaxID=2049454 RepID=UPI000C19CD7B|nr:metallophosphoesterase [Gloeocapsopsis sp. IPPAS B-1203]PIG93340.1 metallophosphoesterase [Gloeocapsopsis sp. IPPAS B-1203]